MRDTLLAIATFVSSLILVAGITWALAYVGEPQSLWLWGDVLGLLP
jgi:hypothetical protein